MKAAIRGHLKTGQRDWPRTILFYFAARSVWARRDLMSPSTRCNSRSLNLVHPKLRASSSKALYEGTLLLG